MLCRSFRPALVFGCMCNCSSAARGLRVQLSETNQWQSNPRTVEVTLRRTWFYLDPLNQPRGPVSDSQLALMLRGSDYFVWTEGMPEWLAASELFADPTIRKLGGDVDLLDAHAQPPAGFNAKRRADRDVHELLGMIRGVLVDGVVSDAEVRALDSWLAAHPEARSVWPASALAQRIARIFADGRIDPDERSDLQRLMEQVIGDRPDVHAAAELATRAPIDDPEPVITFPDRTFVLTGQFVWGARSRCEAAIVERGGLVAPSITRRTHYVVIGIHASRDWIHSSHGRKIEKAVEYRSAGIPVAIVSEEHWTKHLSPGA